MTMQTRNYKSETTDPAGILRSQFTQRSQRNPRYSLRAFARSLDMSHTIVSLVMSGKRPLSRKAARTLVGKLDLSATQTASLLAHAGQPAAKPVVDPRDYEFISLETFDLISDWVHFAILSLLEIPRAVFEPKWVARRLGINEMQAKVAMDRLVTHGFIGEQGGRWRQTGKPIKVENTVSTSSTKKFHRHMLEKAQESLDRDPVEVRDFSSMTLAIDPADIPYAKERIRQFRRELTRELEARGKPKEVYNLTVQIYPVSREK